MSQVLDKQTPTTSTSVPSTAEVLTPKLQEKWALQGKHLLILGSFCLLFMLFNYTPLFHSDVWGHVTYGNWILDHGRLPEEEPVVSLAEGVPLVDTAWLGQVVLAEAGRLGNAEWYSDLFASTLLGTYLVLARTFFLQTRRGGLAVLAAFLVLGIGYSRNAVIRPEIFGNLCFAVLLWLVVRTDEDRQRNAKPDSGAELTPRHAPWLAWIGVPVLFALWANLHGSFVVGFGILGCYTIGRGIEVLWRQRRLRAIPSDRRFRRWLLLSELAVAGSLCNPYGFDLLLHTFLFPSNENLKDVMEWFPLEVVSPGGVPMGLSVLLIIGLLRHSRARVAPGDALLLLLFGLAVCLRVRMIAWYAPVLMLVLTPHLRDVVEQLERSKVTASVRRAAAPLFVRSFRLTLLAPLLVWLTFTFSPISHPLLGGRPRAAESLYSRDTPRGVTAWLREHPPRGMVANPQWWGDWIVWDGPEGIEVMMNTNAVHVVPHRVWKDYLAIARADPGLEQRLDKYRVNTIIVCRELQGNLEERVRTLSGWEVVYEDDVGLVVERTAMLAETGDSDSPQQ